MSLSAVSNWPISSVPCASTSWARSPCETALATSTARDSGRVIERLNRNAPPRPNPNATNINTTLTTSAVYAASAVLADTALLSAAISLAASSSKRAGSRSTPATTLSPTVGSNDAATNMSWPLR